MQQRKRNVFATKLDYNLEQWFRKYEMLSTKEPQHVILESGRGGRYSIIGLRPFAVLEGREQRLSITMKNEYKELEGNILDLMKEWMSNFKTEYDSELPDFQGGAIGYFSYDCIRYIESLPEMAADDLNMPELYFLVFDDVFIFDHIEKQLWIMTHDIEGNEEIAKARLDHYKGIWESPNEESIKYTPIKMSEDMETTFSQGEEAFKEAVLRIQDYIGSGDVFQVNLSVRQTKPLQTPPFHIYSKLRELNPSPYMGYLQTPDFQIVSASPELLVKKKGDLVSTRPIAGTRSRGKTEEEDLALADELISNEKERAEHVMLLDLERNDLGRVSQYGSVEVNEFMVIEKYSHVMHIVSNVQGKLAENQDTFSVVKAVFPGGTITGAPKVRTMEIIEELEPVRRGLYTGSIGWIGFNGDMELNIVIRTMLVKDGLVHVQAGAGIVIDSDSKAEYKESLKKAKALWKAKEISELELEKERKS